MTERLYFVTQDGLIGIADGILLVRADQMSWAELQSCVAKRQPKQQVLVALMEKEVHPKAIALGESTLFTTPEATAEARQFLGARGITFDIEKNLENKLDTE